MCVSQSRSCQRISKTQGWACYYGVYNTESTCLTLLVPSKNPDLNISQGEDGDGLWDTFLKLVLNSCGPQELDTEQLTNVWRTDKGGSGQLAHHHILFYFFIGSRQPVLSAAGGLVGAVMPVRPRLPFLLCQVPVG